ncbi:hypothetical protein GIB67_035649 [Kingdonia uniflora]|uniref:Uncharacterized protein n=1 Tax=Kingdonia uniflora TaxID=39325 RepID=A0A7J7KUR3_9MAGN|nr:hypothetical protein GIB67_035649 [Kingdonia uniflora]
MTSIRINIMSIRTNLSLPLLFEQTNSLFEQNFEKTFFKPPSILARPTRSDELPRTRFEFIP